MNKEYIKEFGVRIFAIAGFTRVLRKLKLNHAVKSYERFKYDSIIRWLDKRYGEEADKAIAGYTSHCKFKRIPQYGFFGGKEKKLCRQLSEAAIRVF